MPLVVRLVRSSTSSINMIRGISAMYGHTFITNGHNPLPCAYNAHNATLPLSARQMPQSQPIHGMIMPNIARITSILCQDARIVQLQRS
jgi:hypothetical protein